MGAYETLNNVIHYLKKDLIRSVGTVLVTGLQRNLSISLKHVGMMSGSSERAEWEPVPGRSLRQGADLLKKNGEYHG